MFIARNANCHLSPYGSAETLRIGYQEVSALPNGDEVKFVFGL